jgi:signal transduction histidine kinase
MVGRVFLLLVGGILASASLTLFLAERDRQEFVAQTRTLHAAERIEQFVRTLDALPPAARAPMLVVADRSGLRAEVKPAVADNGVSDSAFVSALRDRLGDRPFSANQIPCETRSEFSSGAPLCRSVYLTLADGTPLHLIVQARRERLAPSARPNWRLYAAIFATSLGLLAYAVARMATQPLRHLAQAATELGANIERPPLLLRGPSEVRYAASAFNTMQEQLRGYLQERTQMLAAISHDLQTPLTRMRLRIEKITDTALRTKMADDLSAMQDTIRDGLDLARSMHTLEATQRTDFDSILDSVCADAVEARQDVSLHGVTGASIRAQPNAMRRCLTNLIDNAVKYGAYARVTTSRGAEHVVVRVRDGGPGIPEAELQSVFRPFFRLENSRSRDTGGTGIGLTIARNIAEKHGGTLYLKNHIEGGLEAVLELPLII